MSEKTEALRLAEFYEALAEEPPKSPDNSNIRAVAAELRRLHEENESLRAQHASALLDTRIARAQRDGLLEALKRLTVLHDARAAIAKVEGDVT